MAWKDNATAWTSEEGFIKVINKFCEETEDYTQQGVITPSNIKHFLEWFNKQNVQKPEKPTAKFKIV